MADRAFLERLSRELADKGLLIEAGWVGYRLAVMSPQAPPIQLEECKMAFFAGALHLFQSIMTIMDPGSEPTEADLNKMDLIDKELRKFGREFELKATKAKGSA
ncbi:hypothetical protein [Bradyrhizobium sp. 170]|uniref:hypothetical protein n=1 Tax=Bradyrhizobium sp. 170 TaxID=2782641 RepID=UPI001FFE3F7D|nr:hypothetical protein [Bradyrhizobium sp. 170]UPK03079.1 hypothetical protein IVB05_36975 [Bradyrhizobium sp. 170]